MPGGGEGGAAMGGEFERALERTEADANALVRAGDQVTKAAKRLLAASRIGDVSAIDKALDESTRASQALQAALATAREGWTFDLAAHVDAGGYTRELEEAAAAAGLTLHEQDGRIFSYPLLLRILPATTSADAGLTIDRKRDRRMRPSVLAEYLKKARTQQAKFRPPAFLKALNQAYRHAEREQGKPDPTARRGPMVELAALYELLTLAPGQSAEYSRQEFARDLYLLDESNLRDTGGERVEFSASTGTRLSRSKLFEIVGPDGRERVYYALCFWRSSP